MSGLPPPALQWRPAHVAVELPRPLLRVTTSLRRLLHPLGQQLRQQLALHPLPDEALVALLQPALQHRPSQPRWLHEELEAMPPRQGQAMRTSSSSHRAEVLSFRSERQAKAKAPTARPR
jgi:hypothetical protein